jgi:hypothetical protein
MGKLVGIGAVLLPGIVMLGVWVLAWTKWRRTTVVMTLAPDRPRNNVLTFDGPLTRVTKAPHPALHIEDVSVVLAKYWKTICRTIEPGIAHGTKPNDIVLNWYHPSFADYPALLKVIPRSGRIDFEEHGFGFVQPRLQALALMANDFVWAAKFVAEGNDDPLAISIVIFCETPGDRPGETVPRGAIYSGKRLPPEVLATAGTAERTAN